MAVSTKLLPSAHSVFKQKVYVVLRGATEAAGLALDALPLVRPDGLHHVLSELQTCWVTCGGRGREKAEEEDGDRKKTRGFKTSLNAHFTLHPCFHQYAQIL